MTSFPRCLVPVVTVERLTKICLVCNSRFFFLNWPSMKLVKVKFTKNISLIFFPKALDCIAKNWPWTFAARCVMVLIKGRCDDSLHTVMKSLVTSGPSHHMLLSIHWSVTHWYYPHGKAFSLCAAHHMPEIREGSAAGHAGCTHTLEGSPKVWKTFAQRPFFKTFLIATIPPFTLHYGPQTLLHHADVFQPGRIREIKARLA